MGTNDSKPKEPTLSKQETDTYVKNTHFTAEEIALLYKRFQTLASLHIVDGVVDTTEFQTALGLTSKGFAERIFKAFDKDNSLKIEFSEFAHCLSALSPKASLDEKANFVFEIYDNDKNGTISRDELKEVLEFSLSENNAVHLSPQQIEQVVAQTFKKVDSDNSGGITLKEFITAATDNPSMLNCITLNYQTLMDV